MFFKFSIDTEVKSRRYRLSLSPLIIKCQDVHIREYLRVAAEN